jgi:hypothetical protein
MTKFKSIREQLKNKIPHEQAAQGYINTLVNQLRNYENGGDKAALAPEILKMVAWVEGARGKSV